MITSSHLPNQLFMLSLESKACKLYMELARGSNCLANQRSMVLAYTMYANDNDNRIVRGHVDQSNLNSPMWALPPIDVTGAYMSGTPLLEDRIWGLS